MAYYSSSSSDSDEDEDSSSIPSSVTNYHFVTSSSSDNEVPISFSSLPAETPVYLHGTTSDGLQTVYEQVLDWKLDLRLRTEPGVYVKTKTEKWVRLGKPRKFFEKVVRGVLIACQVLHYVKWNLSTGTERGLWDHLRRVFDKFERRPCEDDLVPHFGFMKQFAEQDEALGESQLLKDLLERKGRRRTGEGNSISEPKESFIVADDEELFLDNKNGNDSDEEDEKDLFDSCCCICDNGGDLLCCEGECMRSFHATKVAGEESACRSLRFTEAQVDAIQNFLCRNCQVKQHQCFVCGKLGNSDKSKGAEVFQCSNATCGYFYHPPCVAKLLHPDDESKQTECETDVKNGKFVCPAHRCYICKKLEVKKDYDMNFAVCRRCPKSYHRKCLPRKIAVEADAEERGIMTRAWDNLLPNRLLIYCLKHKIEEGLGTPLRNHVKFPDPLENREKNKELEKNKEKESEENKPVLEKRKRPLESEESPSERGPIKKRELETEQKELKRKKPVLINPNEQQNKRIVKKDLQVEVNKAEGSKRQVAASDSPKFSSTRKIVKNSFPVITEDTKKKIRELYERESAKVTMEDILKKRTIPLTHQNTGRQIEKVPRGKIEGSVEAIQAAYQRISEGKSVDDAKALCEPEVVKQVAKWNKRLGVYLSPFLHGMRYTSFGRHFTKEEKLQEIVNKLHWYVETNDTIVDFCCGSNDFSRLMKQKMDAMGKTCNFKNFDIMYPQNDFCFEKRDWMTVEPKELPTGSSLIMGLNPPFGSKAALANRFIDKALTFKPKLLILIVPKETERLDKKRLGSTRYELVWEDNISLSGKSFYLPGSIDENDNQMDQWNVSAPVLYLWSRSDWATRHKDLAEEHAHFSVYSSDLYEQNGILGEGNGILREDEREAGDIISQVVGDINVEVEVEESNINEEECNNEGGNMEILKGKEKVESDGEMKEREERRERKRKKKEERGNRKRKLIEERERESEGKEEREREGGLDETEWRLNLERERESEAERERERTNEEAQKRAEEREREIEEAKKRTEEREREKEAERRAEEEKERAKEAERRAEEEKERAKEAKRKLAEEEEAIRRAKGREKEAERKLAEKREREKEAKRRSEEKEREKEAKKKAEQKEREIEAKKTAEEEKESKRRAQEEKEREAKKKAEEEREAKRRHEEEKEREAKRRAEEEEEAKRIIAEEESEKELAAKMRAEEKAEEKKRLTQQREREIEARRKRIAEEREKQKEAKRIAEEREREIKAKQEREREAQRKISLEREREVKAKEEREREAQRKISLERERERERRESTERERESTPYFNRRRSSPTISRERNNTNPNSTSRERTNTNPNSTSRERNNTPFDPIIDIGMEISPERNNNIMTKHTSQNQPIETRHLDTINTTNNLLIQSEPIESRHLATQDEFAGLDSLFNNNINEDIDEIAKRYSSGPSYNWSSIGSNYLIDNNNNRGFDDYNNQFNNNNNNPYSLGLMSPIRSIHGNNSSASYLLGFGGTGTSGSVSERYAPRLDETNYLNRPPGFQGQFGNYGYSGLSGYDNTGAVRREIPQPQSDQLGFQSDQLGFQTRNQYRPPPGSSGGWIND